MNDTRYDHSICVIGDMIYVYGGWCDDGTRASFEWLNVKLYLTAIAYRSWGRGDLKYEYVAIHGIFCPISETEIVIMGGYHVQGMTKSFILNTTTNRIV